MNDTMKYILSRRSTRAFLPEQIKEEELQAVLQAALYAPSAHNDQSWHLTVVQDQSLLAALNADAKIVGRRSKDAILRKMSGSEKLNIFYQAPTVIFVSGENSALMSGTDCAAATENMLIAAESVDLGACWIGLASFAFAGDNAMINRQKLLIPEDYTPYYAVALGYKKIHAANALPRRADTVTYIR